MNSFPFVELDRSEWNNPVLTPKGVLLKYIWVFGLDAFGRDSAASGVSGRLFRLGGASAWLA
jgi:hypothetical protein